MVCNFNTGIQQRNLTLYPVQMVKKIVTTLWLFASLSLPVKAWVYPEHRDITLLAIQKLDSAHRAVLDQLWARQEKDLNRGFLNR